MKRIIAMVLTILMVFLIMPSTAQAASENVTLTVKTESNNVNPGDKLNFTVSIGAVNSLGVLQFSLNIPEGLTIDESSIILPEGLTETLDSDGNIAVPSSRNSYKWSYSAAEVGYSGNSDLVLLSFSCIVDEDSTCEEKSIGITVKDCYDNIDLDEHNVSVVPAKVIVEKAKVAVSGVTLDKTSVTLKDGETAALTATVAPAEATNKNVTWSSDNTTVATVANGTVTAVKTGTAKITVTTEDGSKTAVCTVTVTCNHALNKTDAVAATCGKDGNIEYYTCSKCKTIYSDAAATKVITAADVVVNATGIHNETEVKDAVAATEEKEGYTGDTYCKVCGTKVETGSVIPKLDHTHAMTKTDAVAATCEADGNVEYYTCSKCGKTYADEAGNRELASVVAKATGHKAEATWKTDETSHWKICTVCDEVVNKEEHSYKWVVDQAATEDATGLKHEECVCGLTQSENTEIPKLDHAHIDIKHYEAVDATCMAEGNVEYWTCASAKCADKYYGDKDCQIEITNIEIPKNAENHVSEGVWDMDAEGHVRTCACGEKVDEGTHTYDNAADANCNVCNYKRHYIVTAGANAVYEQNAKDGLTFKVDGEFKLFKSLEIDGKTVAAENYTLAEGSTVITLKNSYLDTLTVGTHNVKVLYSDGKEATTAFSVKEKVVENTDNNGNTNNNGDNNNSGTNNNAGTSVNTETVASPKTGDDNNWSLVLLVVMIGIAGVMGTVAYRKECKSK